jgi:FlaA1/EpsC-like NDP-sugar epimerase
MPGADVSGHALLAAVRFGNVLGSRGSVVLTFKQQIAAGGPSHGHARQR